MGDYNLFKCQYDGPMAKCDEEVDLIDPINEQNQLLMRSYMANHYQCMEWLIEHGADINSVDSYNRTILMYACRSIHTYAINWLIEHGADVNIKNWYGCTPFMSICSYAPEDCMLAAIRYADLSLRDDKQCTPLIYACINRNRDAIKILISHHAPVGHHVDINETDLFGMSPIMYLCRSPYYQDMIKLLIDNGADINLADKNGHTALLIACHGNNHKILQLLIDNGANALAADNEGNTPLSYSQKHKFTECCNVLTNITYLI